MNLTHITNSTNPANYESIPDSIFRAVSELIQEPDERVLEVIYLTWVHTKVSYISPAFDDPALIEAVGDWQPSGGGWVEHKRTKSKGAIRPSDSPTCYSFQEFYADFRKPANSKRDCEKLFAKATEKERLMMKIVVPYYVSQTQKGTDKKGVTFRCYPERFINGRYWESWYEKLKQDEADGVDWRSQAEQREQEEKIMNRVSKITPKSSGLNTGVSQDKAVKSFLAAQIKGVEGRESEYEERYQNYMKWCSCEHADLVSANLHFTLTDYAIYAVNDFGMSTNAKRDFLTSSHKEATTKGVNVLYLMVNSFLNSK